MALIKKILNFLSDKKIYQKYIDNNISFFQKKIYNSEKKILVEYFNFKASYISFSYFSHVLSEKYKANIYFYNPRPKTNIQKIYSYIKDTLKISNLDIIKSLNSLGIITPKLKTGKLNNIIYKKILKKIKNKKDILEIKIFSIPVGDIIYDEYLAMNQVGTIEIKDKKFLLFLKHSIDLFLYWHSKLDKNKIKGLICSHTTYFMGLPARIAVFKSIACYSISNSYAFYLTKDKFRQYPDFKEFPKIFKKIPTKISNQYINMSKKMITKFFIGKEKVDTQIYFRKKSKNKETFNVLIAGHCFTDAVHLHGIDRIFEDQFEWIDFLGKASQQTDYNWFVKLHPSQYDNNFRKMNEYIKSYPKLKLLSKETKNKNLLKKINCVLSVHGSVAREFPLFNIPVLNASHDGPYSGYNFSYHFKSLKKYEKAIANLRIFNVKKNQINKVFEHFSIRYLLHYHFMGLNKHIELGRKYKNGNLRQSEFISEWNNQISIEKDIRHKLDVEHFINSKKHTFYGDNTGKESQYLDI